MAHYLIAKMEALDPGFRGLFKAYGFTYFYGYSF